MKLMNLGVAIKEIPMQEKKVGSIIIPETSSAPAKNRRGEVVAVGGGTDEREMEVRVGDVVMYKKDNYPLSEGCEIVHLNNILYVESRK